MTANTLKILVTGVTGQLGQQLLASAPEHLHDRALELVPLSRDHLDLADPKACRAVVLEQQPDWIINAGAYTSVDRAESESDLAAAVNAQAPSALAEALAELKRGGRLLQLSTDFVFPGLNGKPYRPDDPLEPLGVYGRTKAQGEQAVLHCLGPERSAVLRTSWVYGPIGNNFVTAMLRLLAERSELTVVADQVGCPTATPGLALACWRVIERGLGGVLHWSDAGAASWYDFAVSIAELSTELGLLEQSAVVRPISTEAYPTPARRPSYSLLDCVASRAALGLEGQQWRTALRGVLGTMLRNRGST